MDAVTKRRLKHLKRLEATHADEYDERFGHEVNRAALKKQAMSDAMSEHWNAHQKGKGEQSGPKLQSAQDAKARNDEVVAQQAADRQRKAASISKGPKFGEALPENWRDEHWKTLQSWAEDYAGVEVKKKAEAVAVLEAYEARLAESAA